MNHRNVHFSNVHKNDRILTKMNRKSEKRERGGKTNNSHYHCRRFFDNLSIFRNGFSTVEDVEIETHTKEYYII